jgi:aryl carrier-like protein
VADFVQLTQNVDQWWDSFNWLRIEIGGGLHSTDSECGSVVDFVELTENSDQWWDLIGLE